MSNEELHEEEVASDGTCPFCGKALKDEKQAEPGHDVVCTVISSLVRCGKINVDVQVGDVKIANAKVICCTVDALSGDVRLKARVLSLK